MSVFDRARGQSLRGCPICGAKSTVRLNTVIQKLGDKGKPRPSVGRSVSMCNQHGEELFLRIEGEIEASRAGGSL